MPKLFTSGRTSIHHNHFHHYTVDESGNGVAHTAYHPDEPKIKHAHTIEDFSVKEAASSCYPNCDVAFGVDGSPPHIHEINDCSLYASNTMPFAFIDKIVLEGGVPIEQEVDLPLGLNTTSVESDEVVTLYCNFKTNMLNEHDGWFSDTNILNMMTVRIFAISNPSTVSSLISGDLIIKPSAAGPLYINPQAVGNDLASWEQDTESGQLKTYDWSLGAGQSGLFQPENIFKKTLDDGTFVWETPFTIPNLPLHSETNMSFFVAVYLDIKEMAEYLSQSDPDLNLDMDDILNSSEDSTFISVYFENVFSGGSYASNKVQDFRILNKLKMPGFGLFNDDVGIDYVAYLKNLPHSPPASLGILDDVGKNITQQDKKYFSDVFSSRGYNGFYNSIFFVDFVKIIKNNSKFGYLMENKAAIKALLSPNTSINFPVTSLRILRKRVNPTKTFPNKLGSVLEYGDTALNDTEEVLCSIGVDQFAQTSSGPMIVLDDKDFFIAEGSHSKNLTYDNTNGYGDDVFLKDFEFVDKQAKNLFKGSYQYSLEMELFDGTVQFMTNLLNNIGNNIKSLEDLYELSSVPYSGNTGNYIVEQNKLTEQFQEKFKGGELIVPQDALERSVQSLHSAMNLLSKNIGFFETLSLASFQLIEFATPDSIKVLMEVLKLYQAKLEEEIGREFFDVEYPYAGVAKDSKSASNPHKNKIRVEYTFPTLLNAEERVDDRYFDYLTTEAAEKLDSLGLDFPSTQNGGRIRKMPLSKFFARMVMEHTKYKRDGAVHGTPNTLLQFSTPSIMEFNETRINQLIGVANSFESIKLLYDHIKYNDLITKIINHNLHIEYIAAEASPQFSIKFATLKNILSGLLFSDATIDTQLSSGGQKKILHPKALDEGLFIPPPIASETTEAAPRYGDTLPPATEADEAGNWIETVEEGTGAPEAPLVGHEFSLLSILLLHYIIKGPKKKIVNSTKIYDTNFEDCIWLDENTIIPTPGNLSMTNSIPIQLYSLYRAYQIHDDFSKLVITNKNDDPMKNFNYFGSFWMNYKNMVEVEYLDGFEGNNLALPTFKRMDIHSLDLKLPSDSALGTSLLCRLKDFTGFGIEEIKLLNLPVRDRIFVLEPPTMGLNEIISLLKPPEPLPVYTESPLPRTEGLDLAPPRFGPGGVNIAKENLKIKRIDEARTTVVGEETLLDAGLGQQELILTQAEILATQADDDDTPIY